MRRSWAGSRYIKCPWSKLVATRWLLSALCPQRSTWWPLAGFHIVEFLLLDFVLLDSSFNWFEFSSTENSGRNLVDSVAAKSASFRWDNWEPRWCAAKQNTVSNFAFHLQFLLPASASQYSEVLLQLQGKVVTLFWLSWSWVWRFLDSYESYICISARIQFQDLDFQTILTVTREGLQGSGGFSRDPGFPIHLQQNKDIHMQRRSSKVVQQYKDIHMQVLRYENVKS